jgi:hypothetical protein
MSKTTAFYVRIGNLTREITELEQRQKYVSSRWGASSHESATEVGG